MTSVNKDCLFYEEYQDMGAKVDFCTVKGTSFEDTQGCHCDDWPNYYSLDWMRYVLRQSISEREKGGSNDTNETV